MARKRILWLCSWYPSKINPFDGDFIQRHAKAAALYNDIHVIHLAKDEKSIIRKNITEEIKIHNGLTEQTIYFKKSVAYLGKYTSAFKWMQVFKKAIKQFIGQDGKPDVVHVHVPFKAGIIALWIKKKYEIPFVLTEHWGIYNDVEVENYKSRNFLFKNYTKKIFSTASKFLSVSRYLAEGVNKLVMQKPFEIIPNAVDTDLFFYQENQPQKFRFIHVSNMVLLKNVEGILQVSKWLFDQGVEFELVLVGDKDPAIRQYAEKLAVNKCVFFLGEVPYEKVAKEMKLSNALILFSNIENSPSVIGEALCCGLPVISTHVGGVPELVSNKNSILIKPENEPGLADAMNQMIKDYANFDRKKIAEDAKNKFSYPVIGKMFDKVYEDCL